MNIRIQVLVSQARTAIQQVQGDLTKMSAAMAGANAKSGAVGNATGFAKISSAIGAANTTAKAFANNGLVSVGQSMIKLGSQGQWLGRQLTTNLTVPLALIGGIGVKAATDNEKAMTNLIKVYGDASMSTAQIKSETDALGKTFETLSNIYGMARSDVIGIGAAWAAAGSSGLALAKQTQLTMDLMVLGEMNATDATKALVAIQAQYGFDVKDLTTTVAQLNNVENQTGTTMADLVTSMSKSAGVARSTGVDVAHLAAMTAALVPAAGDASQAGNALKTIISRLLAPTSDATKILGAMGIAQKSVSWQSADASTRLNILSQHFEKLSSAQKVVVSTTLASRYQLNKFDVLMAAIANPLSYYYKALAAANDTTQSFNQYHYELNKVLDSTPQKFAEIKSMMQNTLADAMQPMLPVLSGLGYEIATLFQKFSNLSPELQKFIMTVALFLALLGPTIKMISTLGQLLGILNVAIGTLAKPFLYLGSLMWQAASAAAGFAAELAIDTIVGFAGVIGGVAASAFKIFVFNLKVAEATIPVFGEIWAGLGLALEAITGAFTGVLEVLWMGMLDGWKAMTAVFGPAMKLIWSSWLAGDITLTEALGATMTAVWQTILRGWEQITVAFGLVAEQIWAGIKDAFLAIDMAFGGKLSALWTGLMEILGTVVTAAGVYLITAWEAIQEGIAAVQATAGKVLVAAQEAFAVAYQAVYEFLAVTVPAFFESMWAALIVVQTAGAAALEAAMELMSTGLFNIVMFLGEQLPLIFLQAGLAIERVWIAVTTAVDAIMTTFSTWMMAAFNALGEALITIWEAFGAAWEAVSAAFMRGVEMITAAFGAAWAAIWGVIMKAVAYIQENGFAIFGQIFTGGFKLLVTLTSGAGKLLLSALTNPWVLGAIAVIGLIVAFHNQLKTVWDNIVKWFEGAVQRIQTAFQSLPAGVQSSIMAVVNVVAAAAKEVYKWFSYLNPFAHHSPSLVENVTAGMAAVRAQYGSITEIAGPIAQAYAAIKQFKDASLELAKGFASVQQAKDVASLQKAGASNDVIQSYLNLSNTIATLTVQQTALNDAMAQQQAVVDNLDTALKNSNSNLNDQKDALTALQKTADGYSAQMQTVQNDLSTLASTPIQGMKAMDDAMFANQQEQKKLQLAMDQAADAGGADYQSLSDAISGINGQLESLQGRQKTLREAGAGSEILGPIDDQIKALQQQKVAYTQNGNAVSNMQTQLTALQHQADEMDLQKSLDFDGLTRQIQDAASGMKELPFDQIMAGIDTDQGSLAGLTTQYNNAMDAVNKQQSVVDAAQANSDALQKQYDAENDKLSALKDSYDKVTQAIQDMNSAQSNIVSGASGAASSQSTVLQNFDAAAAGNFDTVGGTGSVGREGTAGDQSASIDAWTKQLQQQMGGAFSGLDMFGPIKDMWTKFKGWWNSTAGPFFGGIGTLISAGIGQSDLFGNLKGKFETAKKGIEGFDWGGLFDGISKVLTDTFKTIQDVFNKVWGQIGGPVKDFVKMIEQYFGELWDQFKKMWGDIASRAKPFMDALDNIVKIARPIVLFFVGEFLVAIKTALEFLVNVGKPILDMFIGIFKAAWQVILGILDIFIGIFTGDWGRMWDGVKEIFGGIWDGIYAILKGAIGVIIGVFKTFGDFIANIFGFIWGTIISPVINWIVGAFMWWVGVLSDVYLKYISPIVGFIGQVFQGMGVAIGLIIDAIKVALGAFGDAVKWLWDHTVSPVVGWIKDAWGGIQTAFQTVKDKVSGILSAFGSDIQWLWDHSIGWLHDKIWDFLDKMPGWWKNAVDAIGTAWDNIKDKAKAPIQFVVDVVWNNGLRRLWNDINNLWGGQDIPEFKLATGGVLPGYSPGRDVHKFVSPTGGRLDLSGGEAVMRPEWTRAMGGKRGVDAMNKAARQGNLHELMSSLIGGQAHADGGIINMPGWLDSVLKWIPGMGGVDDVIKTINSKVGQFARGDIGQGMLNLAKTAGTDVWDGVKKLLGLGDDPAKATGNDAGARFPAAVEQWRGMVTTILNMLHQSIGAVNGVLTVIQHESGGNPNAINLWDSNAKAGHPSQGLMQDIPSTFDAWAGAYKNRGITDPFANIYASVRYADARYGSIDRVPGILSLMHGGPYIGYDNGGSWRSGTIGINMSGANERVLSPAQTQSFDKLVSVLGNLDVVALDKRLNGSAKASAPVTYVHNETTTININGDLSFPNITDGDDADVFLRNLADVAAGSGRK